MPCKPTPMKGIVFVNTGMYDFNTAIFVKNFQEFATLETTSVYEVGLLAVSLLNVGSFGRMFDQAVGLYTAHRLARLYDMSSKYEAAGMHDQASSEITTNVAASASSLSEGSTPLQLSTGDDPFTVDLATTRYGLQLLTLIRVWITGGELVTGDPLGRQLYGMHWPPVSSG